MTRALGAGLALLWFFGCGGDSDDSGVIPVAPPPTDPNNPHSLLGHPHERNPILPPPTLESVEAGAVKVAAFVESMSRYGFFAAQDTAEKRLNFARAKLRQLPQMAIDELLAKDMTRPSGSVKVALLELDPENLLTLMPDVKPEKLLADLAALTRGRMEVPKVAPVPGDVASVAGLVERLNAESARWGGSFLIFEDDSGPVGVAFFTPQQLQAVQRDGFNPYR